MMNFLVGGAVRTKSGDEWNVFAGMDEDVAVVVTAAAVAAAEI